jgi:hypothetical protein
MSPFSGMTLDQALRLSALSLAAVSLAALALAGELPPYLLLPSAGCLAAGILRAAGWGARWRKGKRGRESFSKLTKAKMTPDPFFLRGAWNVVVVMAFIGYTGEFFWFGAGLLQSAVHFLVVLVMNKVVTLEERKDFPQLYALSLLTLLATAALTVELWYAAVAAAFMVAAVWSLLLFHLTNEGETNAIQPVSRQEFWIINAVAVGGLCLTVGLFFLTPRLGAGLFQQQQLDVIRTSGFSDRVDLGVIGAIKLDQTVVMRVELPQLNGPPPERLYFRGAAYDRYNGTSWSNSVAHRYTIGRNAEGMFAVERNAAMARAAEGLRQDVLIEALDTPVLFGAPFVRTIEGNFYLVQTDGMDGVYLPAPPAARLHYTVYSSVTPLVPEDRHAAAYRYPQDIEQQYLQLPAETDRVQILAKTVTRDAATVFERVTAIQHHLRTSYRYSLDLGSTQAANPVEEFLFVRQTGYCEHYATAMVLMLRSLGIPARLVTGFLHGEWNDFGNYFTVRQRDAHAWVEVYFPRSGWRTFDPTPTAGVAAPVPIWSEAVRLMDSVRLKWDRLIIRYSLRDQAMVVQGVRARGGQVRDWLTLAWNHVMTGGRRYLGAMTDFIVAGILLGLMIMVFLRVRGRRAGRLPSRMHGKSRHAAALRMYARMLVLLEEHGFRKAVGATPFEFANQISRRSAVLGEVVDPLTALYCRLRFGHDALSVEDQNRAEELLRRLARADG